ncbi:MAG TPA: hypothetical protein VFG79_15330, partial [Solirubrobacter sp.]|nr:hypothetical protein [Solirubrobacter sp.]
YEPAPQPEAPQQHDKDVLTWEQLKPGATANGPTRLESDTNTCTVPDGWTVRIDGYENAILERT